MATIARQTYIGHSPLFDIVLYEAYRRAQHAYPDAGQRLRKGAQLAFSGNVMVIDAHTARVLSQQGDHFYTVNGACDCPDYTDRGGICKHKWASALIRKAHTMLAQAAADSLPQSGKLCPQCGYSTLLTIAIGRKNRDFQDYHVCELRLQFNDTTYACGYSALAE